MKKKTLFAIVVGILSVTIATLAKFEIHTVAYWSVSLPIIIGLNALYSSCDNDNKR